VNPARREPLLWIQLLGLAALPLEALALLLVLAGSDPGLFPGFERVLAWALGALAPAVLFWRLPPDLWSLLLVQVPLRGRRPDQLRLSALQTAWPLKLVAASGSLLLLPLQLLQFKVGADLGLGLTEAQPQALQAGAGEHLHVEAVAETNQLPHVEAEQALGGSVGQGKAKPRHQRASPNRALGDRRRWHGTGSSLGHQRTTGGSTLGSA